MIDGGFKMTPAGLHNVLWLVQQNVKLVTTKHFL